ncbi:hypothetical protein BX616_000200 [Lobosporangium transversale]|uniref:NTF2 domain-containing protein n=1 Tax=Lobosporangium transversale TaxID=64571 RepID=A0A1Y2G562_9FUNG|nr:hypothetical protein BCR41DRAFT_402427 [Lobosporangium transversale]KAF9908271.1 hypothetical protein BX616_000200 [Lobosporangium transversale]ORY94298.1 hypothetical protein BCR41DRAFT_402427 [Lobosporangium transversale]|eukprot:XP_021875241.1 hypothetical protein BCR41DRAFT_402427 [Lobosporangium transversale]
MTAAAANAPIPAENSAPAVASHEVGMMFVHEYYTFLNKEPSRLHCFYNKMSTMSHGTQGEDPYDIHAKILELGFEDCKVLVTNVDSQSSLNGGIMIQVLGEMSNKGGPSQKFVQTFFLAEQPKGYYVLNDIFRYLKEDNDAEFENATEKVEADVGVVASEPSVIKEEKEEEEEKEQEEVATDKEEAVASVEAAVPIETDVIEQAHPPVEEEKVEAVEEKSPIVDEKKVVEEEKVTDEKKAAEEKKPSEKRSEYKKHDRRSDKKDGKKDDNKEAKKDAKKDADLSEKPKTPEPSQAEAAPSAPATAPDTVASDSAVSEAVVSEAAEPSKPATWAKLASDGSNRWGTHVASGARGSSFNVSRPTPKPQTSQPVSRPQGQRSNTGREETHGIYVKNITEKMTIEQLREAFSKFGPVKNFELAPKKNCAYVDFESAEAVQAALKQNRVNIGSEVVLAEERRRPGYQNNGRSFHHQNGNGHQGHQGHQGSHRGRSTRGGFHDRKPIQRHDKTAPAVAVN